MPKKTKLYSLLTYLTLLILACRGDFTQALTVLLALLFTITLARAVLYRLQTDTPEPYELYSLPVHTYALPDLPTVETPKSETIDRATSDPLAQKYNIPKRNVLDDLLDAITELQTTSRRQVLPLIRNKGHEVNNNDYKKLLERLYIAKHLDKEDKGGRTIYKLPPTFN